MPILRRPQLNRIQLKIILNFVAHLSRSVLIAKSKKSSFCNPPYCVFALKFVWPFHYQSHLWIKTKLAKHTFAIISLFPCYAYYRSSDRNYHTLTSTTTISQNERPFVAVKRAHAQAKANNINVSTTKIVYNRQKL